MTDYSKLEQYRDVRVCWDKLADIERECATLKLRLNAAKLVADIAEEGMMRWKREANVAEAEIIRLKQILDVPTARG